MARRVAAALLLLACPPSFVSAHSAYLSLIPNGRGVPNPSAPGAVCLGVGHASCAGGGARNAFGLAFNAAAKNWRVARRCAALHRQAAQRRC